MLPAAFFVAEIRQINMLPNHHKLPEAKCLPARATHNTTCICPGDWQAKPWGTLQQSAWWFDLVNREAVSEKTGNLHERCVAQPITSFPWVLMVFCATYVLQQFHASKTRFKTIAVWFHFQEITTLIMSTIHSVLLLVFTNSKTRFLSGSHLVISAVAHLPVSINNVDEKQRLQ